MFWTKLKSVILFHCRTLALLILAGKFYEWFSHICFCCSLFFWCRPCTPDLRLSSICQCRGAGWSAFAQLFCNLHTKSQHGAAKDEALPKGTAHLYVGLMAVKGGMDTRADWRAKGISSNSVLLQRKGELSPLWRRRIRERGGRER